MKRRNPLTGYPVEHEHVITLEHSGIVTAVARCQCRSFRWGPLDEVLAWIAGHRRKHLPGFRA